MNDLNDYQVKRQYVEEEIDPIINPLLRSLRNHIIGPESWHKEEEYELSDEVTAFPAEFQFKQLIFSILLVLSLRKPIYIII